MINLGTQEEAAEAYDTAAIKFRGLNAVTNFDISRYNVERIMESNALLSGEMARRNKDANSIPNNDNIDSNVSNESNNKVSLDFTVANSSVSVDGVIVAEAMGSDRQDVEETGKTVSHLCSSSSSLSGCREGSSPDGKNRQEMEFSKFIALPMNAVNSWIPSVQMRPQVPLFSAWADAL